MRPPPPRVPVRRGSRTSPRAASADTGRAGRGAAACAAARTRRERSSARGAGRRGPLVYVTLRWARGGDRPEGARGDGAQTRSVRRRVPHAKVLFLPRRGGRGEDRHAPCASSRSVRRMFKAVNHLGELSSDPRPRQPFHLSLPPLALGGEVGQGSRLRGHSSGSLCCIQGCVQEQACAHDVCVHRHTRVCWVGWTRACAHMCVSHRTAEQTV